MLLFNNLLALPLMVAYMVVGTRELQEIRYFPQLDDPLFLVRRLCKHRTLCGACCRLDAVGNPLCTEPTALATARAAGCWWYRRRCATRDVSAAGVSRGWA